MKVNLNDEQVKKLIIAAKIKELKKNPNSDQYIEILKLDPKNPIALYKLHMQTGKLHHQKVSKMANGMPYNRFTKLQHK